MDKNTLAAFALCLAILIAWNAFVLPHFTPPPKKPEKGKTAEPGDKEPVTKDDTAEPDRQPKPKPKPDDAKKPSELKPVKPEKPGTPKPPSPAGITGLPEAELQDRIEICPSGAPLLTIWTNEGAALKRLACSEYYKTIEHKENLTLLKRIEDAPLPFTLKNVMMLSGKDVSGPVEDGIDLDLDTRRYEVAQGEPNEVTFRTGYSNGLQVCKTFSVESDAYRLHAVLTFKNTGADQIKLQYRIIACGGIVPEDATGMHLYTATVTRDSYGRPDVEKVAASKLKKKPVSVEGDLLWAGCDNKYFAAMLHPAQESDDKIVYRATARSLEQPAPEDSPKDRPIQNATMELIAYPMTIPPGAEVVHRYAYFVGPKEKKILAAQGDGELIGLNDYGMFGLVSRALLWLLAQFNKAVPNYGLGIIFLTFVVRVCLHPLSRKTQISMHRMQKLQPLINELKEKYKNDPKRVQMEQWELFKKHRVNPLGGCLPMFIQLPVFLGLFRALQLSIVFRQAPFCLWIKDLSQPDHLATLPFNLPIIRNQFNLLPILMTATWLIQQATMPKPADPQQRQQQKIMMIMPLMFGFMLYHMASGLTLYWMTSTLLGIFEQQYIKRLIANLPDPKSIEEDAPKKSKRQRR